MARAIGNSSLLKDLNRTTILNSVRLKQPISRSELAKHTGLALPTVLRNVDALVAQGYILEVGKAETNMGRKPIMLEINPKAAYVAGVRIGRRLMVVLTDFKGRMIDEQVELADYSKGIDALADRLFELFADIVESNKLRPSDIAGVGFATPGMDFKLADNMDDINNTLANWNTHDAYAKILSRFSDYLVVAEHVTICGAIGEQWFGKTKDCANSVYIQADNGVGSGIIINGNIYGGRDGFAGHIGHTVVQADGEKCYCGNRGCLETYTSSSNLVKRVRKAIANGEPSLLANKCGDDPSQIRFPDIVAASTHGDVLCTHCLEQAGRMLGIGIANIINTINPDKVILGGEVCWLSQTVVDCAIKSAEQNVFSNKARKVDIEVSELLSFGEARGAVALVMNEIYYNRQ